MESTEIVERAKAIATEAHRGQKRRNGDDYITHPARVAEYVRTQFGSGGITIAAAWLHDVLEDTSVTEADLRAAGFPSVTVEMVKAVTRQKQERYAEFIGRIACEFQLQGAKFVKIADLRDNLRDLESGSMRDKYELALMLLGEKP